MFFFRIKCIVKRNLLRESEKKILPAVPLLAFSFYCGFEIAKFAVKESILINGGL